MMTGPKLPSLISEEHGLRKREIWTCREPSTSSCVKQRLPLSSGCVDLLDSNGQHLGVRKQLKAFSPLAKSCASASAHEAGFYVESNASKKKASLEASSLTAVQKSGKLEVQQWNQISTVSKVRNIDNKEVLEDKPTIDETDVATVVPGAVQQQSAKADCCDVHEAQTWFNGSVRQIYIEITPTIKNFLEQQASDEGKRCAGRREINLDFLMQIVDVYNRGRDGDARIKMDELVEGTYIIGKTSPTCPDVQSLSISDRLRIQSEERKYKAIMRDLFGSKDEDVFSNYTQAAALGVNALVGIFVMFLAGYWVAEYSGVSKFTTKCIIGIICSFSCLIVEVMLLLLHDEMLQRKKRRRIQPRS